jgi:hypothetical protein
MRSLFMVLGLSLFSVACGACGAAPPAAGPSSSGAAPAPAGPCHATFSSERPAGWVEVGKLVITVKDSMPTSYELRDASGAKVDAGEVTLKGARAAGDFVAQKSCAIGGVLAVYGAKPSADGPMVVTVVKPAREDEGADLAALCKEPPAPAGVDDAQRRAIAGEFYERHLTTPKWRDWLFDMNAKVRKSDPAGWPAVRAEHADALSAAAKKASIDDCWFASFVRKP